MRRFLEGSPEQSMLICHHVNNAVNIAAVDTQQLKVLDSRDRSPNLRNHSNHTEPIRRESNWNCVRCGTSESPVLCLSCGLIHCGRYSNKDGIRHFEEYPAHTLTMDCNSYAVYCYHCDEYVGTDTLDGKIDSIRNSLREHNKSRTSDHCYSNTILDTSELDSEYQFEEGTEDENVEQTENDRVFPRFSNEIRDEESGSVLEDTPYSIENTTKSPSGRLLRPRKRKETFYEEECPVPVRMVKQEEKREELRCRGIRNLGNTCFMNAVLQALNNIEIFRSYVVSLPLLEADESRERSNSQAAASSRYRTRRSCLLPNPLDCEGNESIIVVTVLSEELRKVLLDLSSTTAASAVAPDALFHAVWQINARFSGYQQQDSHEFLRVMLDRLHNELRRCRVPEECSSRLAASCGVHFPPPTSSPISLLFEGALQSEVTCLSCETTSSKQDPFLDLSLDIFVVGGRAGSVCLLDCIRSFFQKEELDTCEQYMCGRCERKRPSTKQLFLRYLPKVLCLHLKRFRWSPLHRGKLDNMVEFPLKGLDLAPFITKGWKAASGGSSCLPGRPPRPQSTIFDLSSIVVHHGSGVSSGHYTSYGERAGDWYHYNDSSVKLSSEQAVLKQKAYLLFYTRRSN